MRIALQFYMSFFYTPSYRCLSSRVLYGCFRLRFVSKLCGAQAPLIFNYSTLVGCAHAWRTLFSPCSALSTLLFCQQLRRHRPVLYSWTRICILMHIRLTKALSLRVTYFAYRDILGYNRMSLISRVSPSFPTLFPSLDTRSSGAFVYTVVRCLPTSLSYVTQISVREGCFFSFLSWISSNFDPLSPLVLSYSTFSEWYLCFVCVCFFSSFLT